MITLLIALFSALKSIDIIYCDIKGNVKNPGVYKMEQGEVINDLVERAGGLKKNSYVKNINLSKKVTDEMVVYILSNDEFEYLTYVCPKCECEIKDCNKGTTINKVQTTVITEKSTTNITSKNVSSKTSKITKPIITTTKRNEDSTTNNIETTTKKILININTASIDELMKLNGIGEKTALKIVVYRQENKFETIEDIKKVSGIGDSLFAKIKDYITVS